MTLLICHEHLLVPIGVVFTCTLREGRSYISGSWSPLFALPFPEAF